MDFRESLPQRLFEKKTNNIRKYQEMCIGKYDVWSLFKFELFIIFFGLIPGALGLVLRKLFYKYLFGSIGTNVIFGRNLTIRYPHKISIGNNVIIDDNCLLDAKGTKNKGIILNDNIVIGRNSTLTCKEGNITVCSNTQITANVSITTVGGDLFIGEFVGIGGGSRFIGGNHQLRHEIEEELFPEWMIPVTSKGIVLNDRVFIGANVTILDGVTIGRNTVVGAGSIVTRDLPDSVIAVGIPAKVIRKRRIKTKNHFENQKGQKPTPNPLIYD